MFLLTYLVYYGILQLLAAAKRKTKTLREKESLMIANDVQKMYTITNKSGISFEWDQNKNNQNIHKHSVSFDEAITCFDDPDSVIIDDVEHSDSEQRYFLIGLSIKFDLLLVVHCIRGCDPERIRIISARKATKLEASIYGSGYFKE